MDLIRCGNLVEEVKPKMRNVTIGLPLVYVELIDGLVDIGLYPSRSQILREATHEFLVREKAIEIALTPTTFHAAGRAHWDRLLTRTCR